MSVPPAERARLLEKYDGKWKQAGVPRPQRRSYQEKVNGKRSREDIFSSEFTVPLSSATTGEPTTWTVPSVGYSWTDHCYYYDIGTQNILRNAEAEERAERHRKHQLKQQEELRRQKEEHERLVAQKRAQDAAREAEQAAKRIKLEEAAAAAAATASAATDDDANAASAAPAAADATPAATAQEAQPSATPQPSATAQAEQTGEGSTVAEPVAGGAG